MASWKFLEDWQKKNKTAPADMTGGGTAPKSMTGTGAGTGGKVNYGAQARPGGGMGGSFGEQTDYVTAAPDVGVPQQYPTGGSLDGPGRTVGLPTGGSLDGPGQSFGGMADLLPRPQSQIALGGGETYRPDGRGVGSFGTGMPEPTPGTPKPYPTGGSLDGPGMNITGQTARPLPGVPPQEGTITGGSVDPSAGTPPEGANRLTFGARPRAGGAETLDGGFNAADALNYGGETLDGMGAAQPNAGGNYSGSWDGWDDWYSTIQSSGQSWSDFDLQAASRDPNFAKAMYQAKLDYANATTDEARALAHANAEALRKRYRYSGGGDGSRYDPFGDQGVGEPSDPFPFTGVTGDWKDEMKRGYDDLKNHPGYEPTRFEAPEDYRAPDPFQYRDFNAPDPFRYQDFDAPEPFRYDPYQKDYDDFQRSGMAQQLLQQIGDYGPFSYDYTTDPNYAAYAKEYAREGQRASQDALANAAMLTGGIPSSYANTAAQQAGNYYASQLADKIPELRQQAYNEWRGGLNDLMNRYGAAAQDEQTGYQIWSDNADREYRQYLDDLKNRYGIYSDEYQRAWNEYNTNRNFAYGQYSDDYDRDYRRWANDRSFDYNRYLNDRDFGYQRYGDDWNRAYQQWSDENNMGRALNNDRWNRLMDVYGIGQGNYRNDMADALDAAALRAQFGDWSGYDRIYGTDLQSLYQKWLAQQQAGRGYGGNGGDGGNAGEKNKLPVNAGDIIALNRGPLSEEQALKIAEELGYAVVEENGQLRIKKPEPIIPSLEDIIRDRNKRLFS